jgi:glutathione-regulated potassium-efflux system ancillary protein KefG
MTTASDPRRVLVLFSHPALERSRVNARLLEAAQGLEDITAHDLYEAYPDFDVDVRREQELLTQHDVVVFQHPFYWYSTPALLKQWQDLVLEHGWAYGSAGRALEGKWAMAAISTGGRENAYQRDGHNRFTVAQLLRPLEQTATLCHMHWLPPFVAHGTHGMGDDEIERHAGDYRRLLTALRDGAVDPERVRALSRINLDLDTALERA